MSFEYINNQKFRAPIFPFPVRQNENPFIYRLKRLARETRTMPTINSEKTEESRIKKELFDIVVKNGNKMKLGPTCYNLNYAQIDAKVKGGSFLTNNRK